MEFKRSLKMDRYPDLQKSIVKALEEQHSVDVNLDNLWQLENKLMFF